MSVGAKSETGSKSKPTAIKKRLGRLSVGHLAVAVAAILAFVANLAFLRANDAGTTVVVTARQIMAGEEVVPDDFTTASIRADDTVLGTLVTSLDEVGGRVASRTFAAGELVGQSDLLTNPAPAGLKSMAVPIEDAHAAGGRIRVGDFVDLIDVADDGVATFVVRDAPVVAVPAEQTAGLTGADTDHIVLGLSGTQVLRVAEAISDGSVDIVVTTGAN